MENTNTTDNTNTFVILIFSSTGYIPSAHRFLFLLIISYLFFCFYMGDSALDAESPIKLYSSFFFKVSIMSTVILSRSYLGFQPHSARAQLSSILFGQLSAMA